MSHGWAAICRFGGLGDNLIASCVLRPLKRIGYKIEVITSPGAACAFLNNPFVDKLTIKQDGEIPGDKWQEWFASRAGEYDLLVNLSNSCETQHALHRGTTPFWWPEDYRREICAGSYLETAMKIVGVPFEFGPLYFPTDEEREGAQKAKQQQIGGDYIAWVLSGSRVDKVYPYAAHAICRIISELNLPVVLIGIGGQQFEMAKMIESDVKRSNSSDRNLHLALSPDSAEPGGDRHWGTRRSLAQALAADLVVTPDTGLAWAVAMELMPKIVTVSHSSAENITKHWVNTETLHADPARVPCWPCHRLHDDPSTCVKAKDAKAAACMADIKVDTILKTAERLWRRRPRSDRPLVEAD